MAGRARWRRGRLVAGDGAGRRRDGRRFERRADQRQRRDGSGGRVRLSGVWIHYRSGIDVAARRGLLSGVSQGGTYHPGRGVNAKGKTAPRKNSPMREYKMRRGEHLEDRVPDMKAFVEEYFGEVTDTEDYEGTDLLVVDDPDNPVFDRVVA